MPRFLPSLLAALAMTWLLVACGGRERSISVDDASAGAQKAFASASAELKGQIHQAVASYKTNDFVGAIMVLQSVQNTPDLKPEQQQAIDGLVGAVYERLAALIEKGDPKAIKAREQLRSLRR